jgi:hypothetical protein
VIEQLLRDRVDLNNKSKVKQSHLEVEGHHYRNQAEEGVRHILLPRIRGGSHEAVHHHKAREVHKQAYVYSPKY